MALEASLGERGPAQGEPWTVLNHGGVITVTAAERTLARVKRLPEPPVAEVPSLTDASSRTAACRAALAHAMKQIRAEAGAVLLVDRGYLRFVAAAGPRAPSLMGVRLSVNTGVAGYAMQTQRGVLVGQAGDDPRHYDGFDDLTGYRTGQLMAVPVSWGGESLGVLELLNPPVDEPFGADDLARLERMGRKLGRILLKL